MEITSCKNQKDVHICRVNLGKMSNESIETGAYFLISQWSRRYPVISYNMAILFRFFRFFFNYRARRAFR